MPTFKSSEELKSYILKNSGKAVMAAAQDAYEIVDDVIGEFYASNDPKYYKRTGRLMKSLTDPKMVGDCTAEFHFDASRLDYPKGKTEINNPPLWKYGTPYYTGWAEWDGEDVLQAAMVGPSKRIWTNSVRIWPKSMSVVRSEIYDILKTELRAAGIPIK